MDVEPERIALILAPTGRDAELARALLREAGIAARPCPEIAACARQLGDDTTFLVIAEEAILGAELDELTGWISRQPSWSHLPVLLLTRHGALERTPRAAGFAELLGDVTFLERPFHPTTFISLARSAIRSRLRQYEARARIEELRASEESLRLLNESLERRVADRTSELNRIHGAVIEEMEQRRRVEDQLRQAQKMEAVGQLTGGVAHDFNNLLMAVLGNLQLLRKRLPADPKSLRLIDGSIQGAERGAALTRRLLAFARRQELSIGAIDLEALARGMEDLLVRSVGQGITIEWRLGEGLPPATADGNQVELALLNLAVNARDAMPGGGVVTISLDQRAADGDDLAPGSYLRLAVADTGVGMDAATLERAIDPFFTTKGVGQGTGLGLSMIHGLAVQLSGALKLRSRPGEGTVAELWLPVAPEVRDPVAAPAASAASPSSAGSARILAVDDDALILMSTVDMLEDLGHSVTSANSGARALELIREGTEIDLLITDFSMPGMSGAELARSARELRPDLPILLATGYAELPEGHDHGYPRLSKPYQQDQLAAEISRILSG